jgi:hypothetical protein
MKKPNLKKASGSEPGAVSPKAWNEVIDAIEGIYKALARFQPRNSASVRFKTTPDGFTAHASQSRGTAPTPLPCAFGEIIDIDDETAFTKGIRGGLLYAGDKNFDVPYHGINLATAGTWLIQLKLTVEANRDDDNEILLAGIKTSPETDTATFWDAIAWTVGPPATQYDDNENPEVADGLGNIVIPIGKLVVASGAARFVPVACGNITVAHCAGILSHSRA